MTIELKILTIIILGEIVLIYYLSSIYKENKRILGQRFGAKIKGSRRRTRQVPVTQIEQFLNQHKI